MALLFYLGIAVVLGVPIPFLWSFWRDAKKKGWNWTTESSRAMYVDICKTLLTASGVAVALVASDSPHASDSIAKSSARWGVIFLIACIVSGLATMLALTRGHERARSRNIDAGGGSVEQGQLTNFELRCILIFGYVALSTFVVGLLFLGRITFHT